MYTESELINLHRTMAWERAKGELKSMLPTYPNGYRKEYEGFKKAFETFVKEVEENAYQE